MESNIIGFALKFFDGMIGVASTIWNFMSTNFTIGFDGIQIFDFVLFRFAIELNLMDLVLAHGGTVLITFIVLFIAKLVVPFM